MSALRCTVAGCGRSIYGATGVQECAKLERHLRLVHGATVRGEGTLEARALMEQGVPATVALGGRLTFATLTPEAPDAR